jgi:hypothetical protein
MPKGVPNPAGMYGIYIRPWGFEVSIVRAGVRHRESFGRASYGGIAPALAHAQRWRDALVKSLPPPTRRSRAEQVRPNNKTGIPGVFRLLTPSGKILGWLAKTYLAHDQILRALFLASDQGSAARSMAIRERGRQLEQMSGLAKVHPAEEAIRKAPPRSTAKLPAKRSKSEIVRKNNRSGVSGVTFKSPRPKHPGYWMAITYTAGKGTASKAFSVAEHGYDKARTLAEAERRRQLAQKKRESRQAE